MELNTSRQQAILGLSHFNPAKIGNGVMKTKYLRNNTSISLTVAVFMVTTSSIFLTEIVLIHSVCNILLFQNPWKESGEAFTDIHRPIAITLNFKYGYSSDKDILQVSEVILFITLRQVWRRLSRFLYRAFWWYWWAFQWWYMLYCMQWVGFQALLSQIQMP